jgi:hypothetical protein
MNKYSNASDFTSIFIPRVFANITKERITHIVENVVPLGGVDRIDIVEIDDKTNRVWVHFTHWYDTEFVNEFKKLLLDETKQAKIVYDDPWFWIVLKNTHRLANGQPKIRLDLEEPAPPATSSSSSSPKSTVTFTTSQKRNNSGKYREWADVESSDDEETTCSSSVQSSNYTRPPSPPGPPPYLNAYYYPQPYMFQVPYPMMYYPPAPPLPHFTQQYNQFPIAPSLPIHYHPVASWNGVPYIQPDEIDDMDEIDDDAFLTEKDYLEILAEIEDGELYDDEDVYNMYLLEKEELTLINQENCDDYDGDTVFEYAQVYETFGTGFGEETVVFNDYCDAPLKSDVKSETIPQANTKSSSPLIRSLDKFARPIISFKNKITSSPTFTRPLQTLASSYKDMLMVKTKM